MQHTHKQTISPGYFHLNGNTVGVYRENNLLGQPELMVRLSAEATPLRLIDLPKSMDLVAMEPPTLQSFCASDFYLTENIRRADGFSARCHASIGQLRKFSGDPYITHPRQVAALISTIAAHENEVMAALLHDVVEDIFTQRREEGSSLIIEHFGYGVFELVDGVTDVSRPQDGNRAKRKALDRAHLTNACAEVHSIKLADIITNVAALTVHGIDSPFAPLYLNEKKLTLPLLYRGHILLQEMAEDCLDKAFAALPSPSLSFN